MNNVEVVFSFPIQIIMTNLQLANVCENMRRVKKVITRLITAQPNKLNAKITHLIGSTKRQVFDTFLEQKN